MVDHTLDIFIRDGEIVLKTSNMCADKKNGVHIVIAEMLLTVDETKKLIDTLNEGITIIEEEL